MSAVLELISLNDVNTLGTSTSGAGKARREFADEGESEHNPRQLGAVSNTCNC